MAQVHRGFQPPGEEEVAPSGVVQPPARHHLLAECWRHRSGRWLCPQCRAEDGHGLAAGDPPPAFPQGEEAVRDWIGVPRENAAQRCQGLRLQLSRQRLVAVPRHTSGRRTACAVLDTPGLLMDCHCISGCATRPVFAHTVDHVEGSPSWSRTGCSTRA